MYFLFILAGFLVFAIVYIIEGIKYDILPLLFLGMFCAVCFITFSVILCGNLSAESHEKGKTEDCREIEKTNAGIISIDHFGTYTIIGKDLDDGFVFVLEDKSGKRYVVSVERNDYHSFKTGDELTCAFLEKISRNTGETIEYTDFEVLDTEQAPRATR